MSTTVTRCTTNKVRLSYCHLFTPRPTRNAGEKAKYSVTLLIPKTDTDTLNRVNAAIQAAIDDGIARAWKGIRPPQPAMPLHDGDGIRQDGQAFGPECQGCWVITASDEMQPKVVDMQLNPILDQTQVYSGCYGRVGIRFFAYDAGGKRGIGCGLDAVQKIEDGEPLGGRGPIDPANIFGAPAPIPAYTQPTYPPTAPTYAPPAAPAYQQPAYQQPTPTYQQPTYPQQPMPATQAQINPITGQPITPGGVLGL